MGMLINGVWSQEDLITMDGEYVRPASPVRVAGAADTACLIRDNRGRFWLIASKSCPWSHRAVLLHSLKQLSEVVPVHFAHGARVEGYAADGGAPWQVPGSARTVRHLHQLYSLHAADYTGRASVPLLWDSALQTIVSNESADILLLFDQLVLPAGGSFTVRPAALLSAIDDANYEIYRSLNNAVYQAGFARVQAAYEEAVSQVFDALDALEDRLSVSRYYFGNVLTETDLRLFPTLVRFDAVYHVLFKCCVCRLVDYPNIWAYARDLFAWKGVEQTVDFEVIRSASYLADTHDPFPLVAVQPAMEWTADHGRGCLGDACLTSPDGSVFAVDPKTLIPLSEPQHA